jgi:hypothetical protein
MLSAWTIGRATGIGFPAGLLALILWPLQRAYESLVWPLALAASVAAFCGFSILVITAVDLLFHRRRGPRIRPVRAFDVVLGGALLILGFAQLRDLAGQGLLTLS